jgi:hypothetical protein
MKEKAIPDLPWSLAGEQFHRTLAANEANKSEQEPHKRRSVSGQTWVRLFGSETCLKLRGPRRD